MEWGRGLLARFRSRSNVSGGRIGGRMLHLIRDWFGWPDGSVLTNLVASALCVGFGIWKVLKSHKRLHASLERLHEKHDRLHEHLRVPPSSDDA